MTALTIGSLFSGYGGLDMGAAAALGPSRLAWVCEIDPAPARILAHHHPDVPNLGDITAVGWASVERVDVLTGGFPCQDLSLAGARAGLREGTRSGLWSHMAAAIDALRPELVLIENVRGLLSASAHSDVEWCPWCLGHEPDESPLRALGAVLGDLADLRYDAAWHGLRAADVGAPHGRFRVFIAAWPAADAYRPGREGRQPAAGRDVPARGATPNADGGRQRPDVADVRAGEPDAAGRVAADSEGDGRDQGWPEPARLVGGPHAPLGGAAPGDATGGGDTDQQVGCDTPRLPIGAVAGAVHGDRPGRASEGVRDVGRTSPVVAWGPYAAAVARWEHTLGRVAPAPTEPAPKGGQRLSPRFVEWMMGLPEGWVTDVGLTRNEKLKALGNGVVPQQAAAAVAHLLAIRAASTEVAA